MNLNLEEQIRPQPLPSLVLGVLACALAAALLRYSPAWKFRDAALLLSCLGGGVLVVRLVLEDPARRRIASLILRPEGRVDSEDGHWRWLIAGGLVVCAAIALLEWRQPYYFTEDDNFSQFLPVMLQGCRSFFHGVFPEWNPDQLMGAPTTSLGVYALTYPPTYVSYAIARWVCGRETLTLEMFCALHLLLGYWACFAMGRAAGLRGPLASAASLCMTLSGYSLIAGRSWYYMAPVLVWTPLLVIAVIRLQRGPVGWKWAVLTGAEIGLFFHAGNAQMWLYALMLCGVAVVLLAASGELPLSRAIWILPAGLFGLAIAAPLLFVELKATEGVIRAGGSGGGILPGLGAILLPYPLSQAPHPNHWGSTQLNTMGQFYYSGSTFMAVAAIGVMVLLACKWSSRIVASNVWLLTAFAAFVLALGSSALVWDWLCLLPVFNRLEHPFKFLAFVNLFGLLAGGQLIERWIRARRPGPALAPALAAITVGLLLYHASLCRPSFYSYGDRPYPALPAPLRLLLQPGAASGGRMESFAPLRCPAPGYVIGLQQDFPTVYGVMARSGYDLLVDMGPPNEAMEKRVSRDPVAALQAYGVRWILATDTTLRPVVSNPAMAAGEIVDPPTLAELSRLVRAGMLVLHLPAIALWELPHPAPLAFRVDEPEIPIPITFSTQGAAVDLGGLPAGKVVINVLMRRELKAQIDGNAVPLGEDAWGRALVEIYAGARHLTLRYTPPWNVGFAAGGLLALFGLTAGVVIKRKEER